MKQSHGRASRIMHLAVLVAAFATALVAAGGSSADGGFGSVQLRQVSHIVVIYEENHSFDNLYGGWEGVNGPAGADLAHTLQVGQNGAVYHCLQQNDANLTSPVPLSPTCTDTTTGTSFVSAFFNGPFTIDGFIPPSAITCPPTLGAFSFPNGLRNPGINPATGLPVPGATAGGCTRDLVHRFYQEQYQLNGGQMNRYVTGSDAIGLTMGGYDTHSLPIYRYLHSFGHPRYVIADNFFQAAFGGSFLNHQWLIAAATPTFPGAPSTLHSIVDANGFPNATYPLYHPATAVRDGALTVECTAPLTREPCGDYAVNTTQPAFQPSGAFGAKIPPQTNPTIGDRMSAGGSTGPGTRAAGRTRTATSTRPAGRTAPVRPARIPRSTRASRPIRAARTTCSNTTTNRSTTTPPSPPRRRKGVRTALRTCATKPSSCSWRTTRPAAAS